MYQQAIDAYTSAITLDPDYGYAYYNRAATWEMMRKPVEMCQDFMKAASLGVEAARNYTSDCE